MGKKLRLVILIVIIIAQLLVPIGMMSYKSVMNELTCQKGEIFKFYLDSIVYNDGSIDYYVAHPHSGRGNYAILKTDINGYAQFKTQSDKPEGDNYIKSPRKSYFVFPVDEIEAEKYENIRGGIRFYSMAEYGYSDSNVYYFDEAYLEAYVYKGNVVPKCIYVDGVLIDEYLSEINQNLSAINSDKVIGKK